MLHNKWIILTFSLALSFGVAAQDLTENQVAENNIFSTALNQVNIIDLYPNPAVDFLVVEISNLTLEHVELELRSIIGNKIIIRPEELGHGKYRIPVKELASGYYFVVVKDDFDRFKKATRFLKN
ncbi:MAG: T9SS type A sorting domain-containing protein [Cyclobacteriaceae bacterium]|nr:T9SS type A sorting domain-containing protein [Cyclobacteriaceae bacterium HetDA_MAG_MS6]